MLSNSRARYVAERFRAGLGYQYAKPWPILARERSGPVMYYMIHASDHPASVRLMDRAYLLFVVSLDVSCGEPRLEVLLALGKNPAKRRATSREETTW